MSETSTRLSRSARAVESLGDPAGLTDAELLAAQTPIAALRRQLDAVAAAHAGEIARRSDRELGNTGLAQKNGFLNAAKMIEASGGMTGVEATKLVAVGTLLSSAPDPLSWRDAVATALRGGELTVEAANSITRGLAGIDDHVAAVDICAAARGLILRARSVRPDALFREARASRDRLDARGIAERETARHEERYFHITQHPDGMYRGSFALAPEDGALVSAAFDTALAPRRGGPRFVDADWKAEAQKLIDDTRTNPQIAADTFTQFVRLAVAVDPSKLVASRRPAVRVHVTEKVLADRAGFGTLEGNPDPVSFATVERHICETGLVGVLFDQHGERVINIGRNQRLYTERQRVGIGARDGGCRFPDCDRPPSWCEAHHINEWKADHGKTNIDDGVLLCQRHHLLLHNNHWKILRDRGTYWLRPPADIDPGQTLIPMPTAGPRIMRSTQ